MVTPTAIRAPLKGPNELDLIFRSGRRIWNKYSKYLFISPTLFDMGKYVRVAKHPLLCDLQSLVIFETNHFLNIQVADFNTRKAGLRPPES